MSFGVLILWDLPHWEIVLSFFLSSLSKILVKMRHRIKACVFYFKVYHQLNIEDWLIFGNLLINLFEMWGCVVGGESTANNCQILQSRVNRFKSDKYQIDSDQLKGYSCDVNFTGMHASLLVFLCFEILSFHLLCILPILSFRESLIQPCSSWGNNPSPPFLNKFRTWSLFVG